MTRYRAGVIRLGWMGMYTWPSTCAVALADKIITVSSHGCVCSGMAAPGENVAAPDVMLVAPFCLLTEHPL